MADFGGKIGKFCKMPWPLWPTCQTEREIVEISHLAIHKMYTCCIKWGQRQNFAKSQYYICYLKIDLIDSWAEIKVSIVAHNLPIEKWNFD